jgi:hypothetical protein
MLLLRTSMLAAVPLAWKKPVVAFAVAGALAGCSARSDYGPAANVGMNAEAQRIAAAPVREEMEDDGLPAQRPPLLRANPRPDNPNEPFSRNYGGPPIARQASYRRELPAIPDDLPPDFHRRLIVATGER